MHLPQFQHIRVSWISTGGSFEKDYPQGTGITGFEFPTTSAVPDIIARAGVICTTGELYKPIDSLEMDDEYRRALMLRTLNPGNWEDRIVIVHGTDTMIDTAAYFAAHGGDLLGSKVIVFTGASRPALMRDTDADGNVASAIMAARLLPPGIYIAMHGQVFSHDACHKSSGGTFHFKEGCHPFELVMKPR